MHVAKWQSHTLSKKVEKVTEEGENVTKAEK